MFRLPMRKPGIPTQIQSIAAARVQASRRKYWALLTSDKMQQRSTTAVRATASILTTDCVVCRFATESMSPRTVAWGRGMALAKLSKLLIFGVKCSPAAALCFSTPLQPLFHSSLPGFTCALETCMGSRTSVCHRAIGTSITRPMQREAAAWGTGFSPMLC